MKRFYGIDALNRFLLFVAACFSIAAMLLAIGHVAVWYWVTFAFAVVSLLWAFVRIFSKKRSKRRRRELYIYKRLLYNISNTVLPDREYLNELKEYKYYACPQCAQRLRVPRGKGRIRITCIRCGNRFIKKT